MLARMKGGSDVKPCAVEDRLRWGVPPLQLLGPLPENQEHYQDFRNNVHLFAAVADPNAHFQAVLQQEQQLLTSVQTVIAHVAAMTP